MTAQYAVITLSELPPSVNNMFANRVFKQKQKDGEPKKKQGVGRVKTPQYRAWIELSGHEINRQKPPHVPGPYAVQMRFGRKNKRADLDNVLKAAMDILVEHHIVEDDCFCKRIVAEWVTEPGVHIMVVSTKEVGA